MFFEVASNGIIDVIEIIIGRHIGQQLHLSDLVVVFYYKLPVNKPKDPYMEWYGSFYVNAKFQKQLDLRNINRIEINGWEVFSSSKKYTTILAVEELMEKCLLLRQVCCIPDTSAKDTVIVITMNKIRNGRKKIFDVERNNVGASTDP